MDPTTLAAIITGGGGLLSSLFGGSAESDAIEATNALRREEREDAKLGATDARGTRTYFKDGVGWVTEYGPTDQMLEDYYVNVELPQMQNQFERTAAMSGQEADVANSLLDEFRRIERGDPNDIGNLLYSAAARSINENAADTTEIAMRNALRQGSSRSADIADQISEGARESLGDAAIQSKLQAMDYVDSQYSSDRADTTNLYNSFANRSRTSLAPTTGSPSSPTIGVVGSQPQGQSVQPNYGMANAVGGASSSLGGIFNTIGANQQRDETNDLLRSFIAGGGGYSLANGGIFGDINSRSGRGENEVF